MKTVRFLFHLLIFTIPLVFFPHTSELFEFNKIVLIYFFTILISALWAYDSISNRRFVFKQTPLTIPLFIFVLTQCVATIFSIDTRTSLFGYHGRYNGGLFSTISYTILYFAFTTHMRKEDIPKILQTLLVSVITVATYAALEHFGFSISCLIIKGQVDADCFVQNIVERVFGTFGQPNWLAAFLAATSPIFWYKIISRDKIPISKVLYYLAYGLLISTLLFTKSRSGFLGLITAGVIFWAFSLKSKGLTKAFINTIITVTAITIFALALAGSPIQINQNTDPGLPSDEMGGTESGAIRQIVWKGAWDLFLRYPIAGTGVETFAFSYYETRPVEHNLTSEWNYLYNKAHNEYLNYLATTGLLGFSGYVLIIIYSLKIMAQKITLAKTALLSGYTAILVTNFFGFSTVAVSLLFFLFPAAGVVYNQNRKITLKFKFSSGVQKFLWLVSIFATLFMLKNIAYYWLGDYYYADAKIERAIAVSPNEPLYRLKRAEILGQLGNIPLAQKEINLILNSSPRNIKLRKDIAEIYDDFGEKDEIYYQFSRDELIKISQLAPTDVQNLYRLALAYGKTGDIQKAYATLMSVIKMKPDYKLARKFLSSIYLSWKDYNKAKQEYEYILEYISPNDNEIKELLLKIKDI